MNNYAVPLAFISGILAAIFLVLLKICWEFQRFNDREEKRK